MPDFRTTLHPENDENTNLYPNIKKDNIPDKCIDTSKLSNEVLSMIGSLKPSGTDTAANILAKTTNQGIFVGTDTHDWYYWNGTQYVDGGSYVTNISDVEHNKSNINLLNNAVYGDKIDITDAVVHSPNLLYDYVLDEFVTGVSNSDVLQVTIKKGYKYYVTTSVIGRDEEFPLISYLDSSHSRISYEYMNVSDTITSITDQELYIPDNAAYFYVNVRNVTPVVTERKPIPFDNYESINLLNNELLELKEIEADELYLGKLYYYTENSLLDVANGNVKKINIKPYRKYYVTTSVSAQTVGFTLITYFDENNTRVGYEYMNINQTISIENQELNIPENAAYFYVNARATNSIIKTTVAKYTNIDKEIKILFVGNSLTQDGIAYLPYLLKNFYPDLKFKFYMWYVGGYTLAQHYQRFINNQACEIFSVADNTSAWANSTATMSNILNNFKFDIVCLQEYFNYKTSYTESDLVDFNNCVDYITSNYAGGNPLKFIELFHAPKRDNVTNIYNLTKAGNELILQKTICEDMLANGIAVYKALSTDLDDLGDAGHLSPDGTHTQEGLPCLLQTYVTLLWILNKYGINTSIYGFDFKMTTAIYNTINVPGPNLGTGVIEGTDSENLLAQEVAIKSYKCGVKIVNDNLSD